MEYREFGQTGMRLSAVALGGLLAHYWEGESMHPPPEEKRRIYLRAAELGINLFDMGYGDEVHIPDELKGPRDDRHFSLKVGAPKADALPGATSRRRKGSLGLVAAAAAGKPKPIEPSPAQKAHAPSPTGHSRARPERARPAMKGEGSRICSTITLSVDFSAT